MANFNGQTVFMAPVSGYVLTLPGQAGLVSITSRAAVWVRAYADSATPPSAPLTSPAPSLGNNSPWLYLLPNEICAFGTDSSYNSTGPAPQDSLKYILIWAETGGYLSIVGH